MKSYCVYLGVVFIACFKNQFDAKLMSCQLRKFLRLYDMDADLVKIVEEEI